jgi:competence ComEA-like helix-hairpin-helix protein
VFTSSERRGALALVALLLLGAGWDLWRARRPPAPPPPGPSATAVPTLPAAGSDLPPGPGGADPRPVPLVDLSSAGQAELESLPGIGPVLARRILEHRALAGGFSSVEELRAVPGVGPRLMERLRGRIRAGPAVPAGRDTSLPRVRPGSPGN